MTHMDQVWNRVAPPRLHNAPTRDRVAASLFAAALAALFVVALSLLAGLVGGCGGLGKAANAADQGCKAVEAAHDACTILHFTDATGTRTSVAIDRDVVLELTRHAARQGRTGPGASASAAPSGAP